MSTPPVRTPGRKLTELRRSSAAGPHGKRRKDRCNTERQAVERDIQEDECPHPGVGCDDAECPCWCRNCSVFGEW